MMRLSLVRLTRSPATVRWSLVLPRIAHPVKVQIIEALGYLDQGLSPSQLSCVLARDDDEIVVQDMHFHLRALEEDAILVMLPARPGHGSAEVRYALAPDIRA